NIYLYNTRSQTFLLYCLITLSQSPPSLSIFFFFFNDTATTEIYTLSLHDALPIWESATDSSFTSTTTPVAATPTDANADGIVVRSEEHTSELQSPCNLVCRLLLEKKKKKKILNNILNKAPPFTSIITRSTKVNKVI